MLAASNFLSLIVPELKGWVWKLTVPAPPKFTKPWLSANDRDTHWSRRATLTKYWRNTARDIARENGPRKPFEKVWIVAAVNVGGARNIRRDTPNLYPTVKAVVDGIVEAGILPDDRDGIVIGPDMRPGPLNGASSNKREITLYVFPLVGNGGE